MQQDRNTAPRSLRLALERVKPSRVTKQRISSHSLDNTLRRTTDETPHVTVGCETFSGIKRQEYSYRVSENGMLRKIFGPNEDEVAED